MTDLIVTNGFVYDPLNRINGEKMDIFIRDGKVVESVKDKANIVDASGMVVMPGGVDIHSHIAGGEVDSARLLRPEEAPWMDSLQLCNPSSNNDNLL